MLAKSLLGRRFVSSLFFLFSVLCISRVSAAVITYEVANAGGNRWTYEYSISTTASDPAIDEFTIYFDLDRFANLAVESAPAGWDPLVIQPDPGLAADGFFDALALAGGIAPGGSLGGFSVSFDFLGSGTPGAQPFDIVDPSTFLVIASGTTQADGGTAVPEPGSGWLVAAALGLLVHARGRRQRGPSPTVAAR